MSRGPLALLGLLTAALVLMASLASVAGSFSGPVTVDPGRYDQMDPSVAVSPSGNISVVWTEDEGDRLSVYHSFSSDSGDTFTEGKRLAEGTEANQDCPVVAVNRSGAIFVVWSDERDGPPNLYLSISTDQGGNFSDPVALAPSDSSQISPSLAVEGDRVYVAWEEGSSEQQDVHFTRSLDGGESFSDPVRLDQGPDPSPQIRPSIDVRDDRVFVAWEDARETYPDIYGAWSDDAGTTFQEVVVSQSTHSSLTRPAVSFLPDGNVTVAWEEDSDGSSVKVCRSHGQNFSDPVRVGGPEGDQSVPAVTVGPGGNISVVFDHQEGEVRQVFYSESRDGGSSFTTAIPVEESTAPQRDPDLAILSGEPCVVYEEVQGDHSEIRFARMINVPPTCSLSQPSEGQRVNGTMNITGTAGDPDGNDPLLTVQVRVHGDNHDSGWMETPTNGTWELAFNTTQVVNGEYHVQARSFDGSAYSETSSMTITVDNPDQAWPDLEITPENITLSTSKLESGSPVSISAKVANVGTAEARGVEVEFLRETFSGEIQIGDTRTISLQPGENDTVRVGWLALEGTHTIRVRVDPEDRIVELDEDNDEAEKQIEVKPPGYYRPDLNITQMRVLPDRPHEGEMVRVNVSLANQGNRDARQVPVVFQVDGSEFDRRNVSVEEDGTIDLSADWNGTGGDHRLTVVVDPENRTHEHQEDNNRMEVNITVQVEATDLGWYVMGGIAGAVAVSFVALTILRRR